MREKETSKIVKISFSSSGILDFCTQRARAHLHSVDLFHSRDVMYCARRKVPIRSTTCFQEHFFFDDNSRLHEVPLRALARMKNGLQGKEGPLDPLRDNILWRVRSYLEPSAGCPVPSTCPGNTILLCTRNPRGAPHVRMMRNHEKELFRRKLVECRIVTSPKLKTAQKLGNPEKTSF